MRSEELCGGLGKVDSQKHVGTVEPPPTGSRYKSFSKQWLLCHSVSEREVRTATQQLCGLWSHYHCPRLMGNWLDPNTRQTGLSRQQLEPSSVTNGWSSLVRPQPHCIVLSFKHRVRAQYYLTPRHYQWEERIWWHSTESLGSLLRGEDLVTFSRVLGPTIERRGSGDIQLSPWAHYRLQVAGIAGYITRTCTSHSFVFILFPLSSFWLLTVCKTDNSHA